MPSRPPVIVKPEEGKKITGAFGGYGYRILTPKQSPNLVMGTIYVDPGKAPHRWHNHHEPDSAGRLHRYLPRGLRGSLHHRAGPGHAAVEGKTAN